MGELGGDFEGKMRAGPEFTSTGPGFWGENW